MRRFSEFWLAILIVFGAGALVVSCTAGPSSGSSSGSSAAGCQRTSDCPSGQACQSQRCVLLPCDGRCAADEVCQNERCRSVEGVSCASLDGGCPAGYLCAGGRCEKNCESDLECTSPGRLHCNPDVGACSECTFARDCMDPLAPFCDPGTGRCVGCVDDRSCDVDGAPSGRYCDSVTRTCQRGCQTASDCPPGTRGCVKQAGSRAGMCAQCQPSTEGIDCLNDGLYRCDPGAMSCVECLDDIDCGARQCDPTAHKCVDCRSNDRCDPGFVCDLPTSTCVAGCAGGTGQARCPVNESVCDSARGERGRCVACLRDADCPRTRVCDLQGAPDPEDPQKRIPACVVGCTDMQTRQANDQRCLVGGQEFDFDTKCDPTRGTRGRCIQCRSNAECPSNEACEVSVGVCRCKKEGESCADNSECGFRQGANGALECTAQYPYCITQVKCRSGSQTVVRSVPPVCTRGGGGVASANDSQNCPTGFVNEDACDARGNCHRQCVPAAGPYNCLR